MSTIKSIARNTSLLVAANIISLFIGFIQNIYLARYLEPQYFGLINAALNLATIFTYATDLGIGTYLVMHLARSPKDLKHFMGSAITLKTMMVTIAYVALVATAYLLNYTGIKLLVVILVGVYVMLTVITQLLQVLFQVNQTMEHIAICQLLNPIILTAGLIYVLWSGSGVVVFSLIYVLSGLIILIYTTTIVVRKYPVTALTIDRKLWVKLIIGGIPFCLGSILYYLYFKIDIQLINSIIGGAAGDVAVGYYSAAFKFIEAMMCIPTMYTMVTFPLVSHYFHKNSPYLSLLAEKSIKYLAMIGIPACIGIYLLADKFIFLCFDDKYVASIGVLQALSIGLVFIFIGSFAGTVLLATNQQRISVLISAAGAVLNILLNLAVIPTYGIIGSAYAMVVTQLVLTALTYYYYIRSGNKLPNIFDLVKVSFCALAMGVLVYYAHDLNLLIVVPGAIVIYLALIVVTRSLSQDDIAMISGLILKKKVGEEPIDTVTGIK